MAVPAAVVAAAKQLGKRAAKGVGRVLACRLEQTSAQEEGSGPAKAVVCAIAAILVVVVAISSPMGLWDIHSEFLKTDRLTSQSVWSFGGLDDGTDEDSEEMFLYYEKLADRLEDYARSKWNSGTGEDVYSTPDWKSACAFCTAVSENDFELVKANEDYYEQLCRRLLRATSVTRYRTEVCDKAAQGAYPTRDGVQISQEQAEEEDGVVWMRKVEYKTWTVSAKPLKSAFSSGTASATGSLSGLPWLTDEFVQTALEIQSAYGIYASVTIAQAQLEVGGTWDGSSLYETAAEANNYFGHKAKSGADYWEGMCTWDGVSKSASGIYKAYDSVSQCLWDRARLLLTSGYYADVAATAYGQGSSREQLEALSNSPWCEGGYDTLETIMNAYDLFSLDSAVSDSANSTSGTAIARTAAELASGCYPAGAVSDTGLYEGLSDTRTKAYRQARQWCEERFGYTFCNSSSSSDAAVGVAVRLSGADPEFSCEGISEQLAYMESSDIWLRIGTLCPGTDAASSISLVPGDILVTTQGSYAGHIEIYVGSELAKDLFDDAGASICIYQAQTGRVWPCLSGMADLGSDGREFTVYRCTSLAFERTHIGSNPDAEGKALGISLKGQLAENYKETLASVSIEGNLFRSIRYNNDMFVDAVVGKKAQGEVATEEQKRIVDACKTVSSPAGGLCATWVTWVYRAAGVGVVPYGNACDMWANYCTSSDRAKLQPGMIIAVQHSGPTGDSWTYGHVGIYVGDGMVMHSIGFIQTTPLDEWIAENDYSGTVAWGYPGDIG